MKYVIKDKQTFSKCFFSILNESFDSQKDIILFDKSDFSFSIALRGESFNATINADIAKSIIKFQDLINHAYACYLQKESVKKLTTQERKECEIYVKVEAGSTLLKFFLKKLLNPEIINRMEESTKKLLILVTGSVILGATAVQPLFHYLEDKNDTVANAHLGQEAFETVRAAYRYIAKSNAEEIIINDEFYSPNQLKELTKNESKPKALIDFDLSGMFKVLSIEIDYQTQTSFAKMRYEETGEIYDNVNLQDCYLSEEKLKLIKEAEKGDPISLEIHISKEGDKIRAVYLKL